MADETTLPEVSMTAVHQIEGDGFVIKPGEPFDVAEDEADILESLGAAKRNAPVEDVAEDVVEETNAGSGAPAGDGSDEL